MCTVVEKPAPLTRWKPGIIKILEAGMIALILFVVGMKFVPGQDYTIYVMSDKTEAVIQPPVQKQQTTEKEIEAYYRSATYSFENPLILQNPYGTAPLTALAIFDTPQATQISIHIPGKTPQASVDFTFAGFNKHHEIPIYGLYADDTNQVTLIGKNQAGEMTKSMVELKTEPLPVYLNKIKIVQVNPDLYNPGMNFTFDNNKLVFDINGDVRWYSIQTSFQTYAQLENGHYLVSYIVPGARNNVLMEQDLLGKIYAVYNAPNGANHDFTELPNGNILVTGEDISTFATGDFIDEIDRQNGHIVRSFDLKNYLDRNRPSEIDLVPEDWLHLNSIVYDPIDQSIIFSGRAQSAVIKMSYPEMKIQWILGPHDHWKEKFQPYLLTPVGDPFEWQWSQHHATILSDKTINGSKIIDLLLFDNGDYRSFDAETALTPVNSYSRIVHYQINETNRTIRQIWEYGKERGSEIFSISRGSAYVLGNGNFLGTWSEIIKDKNGVPLMKSVDSGTNYSKIIEVDPVSNKVVFEANTEVNYRTFRANLYEKYSQGNSILSVKLNDTTTLDPGERAVIALQPLKKQLDMKELWVKGASIKAWVWISTGKLHR